jgi:uncharacterized protein YkwD
MSKVILVLALGVIAFCGYMAVTSYASSLDTVGVAHKAFDLINAERSEYPRPALIWDNELEKKAIAYSQQMNDTGKFEHSKMPYAENILKSSDRFANGEQVYRPWMMSDGHYRNMVDKNLKYGAIGIVNGYATFLAR